MTFLDLGVLNVLKVGTDVLILNQQIHDKITMLDFRITQNLILLHVDAVLTYVMFYFTLQEWISPLPDGSLPHLQIREGLLKVLAEVNLRYMSLHVILHQARLTTTTFPLLCRFCSRSNLRAARIRKPLCTGTLVTQANDE